MQDSFQGLAVVCNSTYINAGWGVTQRKPTQWYFLYRVFFCLLRVKICNAHIIHLLFFVSHSWSS